MATNYGPPETYTCFTDCEQRGCPGHTLRVAWHRTSDILRTEELGKEGWKATRHFDRNELLAIMAAFEAYTKQHD